MKSKMRKISPSDEELENEILAVIESEEVSSTASPLGVYAIYNRLKAAKKDWMLSPIRINSSADAMAKKGILCKVSDEDRRYFKRPKEQIKEGL
jgi:hypothetical protein